MNDEDAILHLMLILIVVGSILLVSAIPLFIVFG
jgi:hypothetical protein